MTRIRRLYFQPNYRASPDFFFWTGWNREILRSAIEAGIWSCDLRANERPKEKLHSMAQKHTHTDGHGDSMTNTAELVKITKKLILLKQASPTFILTSL